MAVTEDRRAMRTHNRAAVSMCRHIARTADNIAATVPDLDVPAVVAELGAAEIEQMQRKITAGIQAMTQLRRALREESADERQP